MKDRYLEITFRKGKPLAAYFYLTRQKGYKSARTEKMGNGLIADFDEKGGVIGLEITSPSAVNINQIRDVLDKLNVGQVLIEELAPLKVA